MGYVDSYIDCPRCGEECFDTFNYRTGESITSCEHCGYTVEISLVRDEEGKMVLKHGETEYIPRNGLVKYTRLLQPFGAYKITGVGGGGSSGVLFDRKDYEELKDWVNCMDANQYMQYESILISSYCDELKIIHREELIKPIFS